MRLKVSEKGTSFVLSVATVAILVLLFFAVFIVDMLHTSNVKRDVLQSNDNHAEYVSAVMDREISKVVNSTTKLKGDKNILDIVGKPEIRDIQNNISELSNNIVWLCSENSMIYDVVIDFVEKGIVVSREGGFESGFYYKSNVFTNIAIKSYDQSKRGILESTNSDLLTGYPEKTASPRRMMVFSYTGDQYKINYLIDCDKLSELFYIADSKREKKIILIDEKKQIFPMFTDQKEMTIDSRIFAQEKKDIVVSSVRYLSAVKHSGAMDWTYVSLYPYALLRSQVGGTHFGYAILYLLFLFGILTPVIFIRRNVLKPINRLAHSLGSPILLQRQNGVEIIANYVDFMKDENVKLSQAMKYSKPVIKRSILESWMAGEEDYDGYERYFKRFSGPEYMLLKMVSPIDSLREAAESVELFFDDMHISYQQAMLRKNSIVYFVGYDQDTSDIISNMKDIALLHHVIFMFSEPFGEVRDIPNAYNEIYTITQHRNIRQNTGVITKADIIIKTMYLFSVEMMENDIILCLDEGNVKAFMDLYEGFTISDKDISFKESVEIIYILRSIVRQMLIEKEYMREAIGVELSQMEEKLTEDINLFEAEKSIIEIMLRIIKYNVKYDDNRQDKIVAYIKDNFTKCISLENVANRFGMNPKYLSGYIKRQIGMTFTDYIASLRMDAAKKMLLDEIHTIKEVSESLGFDSQSSFNRLFKKVCNMTPVQFRETAKREIGK